MPHAIHQLGRLALAAALTNYGVASAVEICQCDRPPLTTACKAACDVVPPPKGPFVIRTPPPQPPKINPFAETPAISAFEKPEIWQRLPDFKQDSAPQFKNKAQGGLGGGN